MIRVKSLLATIRSTDSYNAKFCTWLSQSDKYAAYRFACNLQVNKKSSPEKHGVSKLNYKVQNMPHLQEILYRMKIRKHLIQAKFQL